MTDDNLKQLYSDLQRAYDLVLDRRKTLTGQATNLMSFAGIIETVLIGLILALATDKDVRTLLLSSPYYPLFFTLGAIGFASYIVTAVFSLIAFWEPQWKRVPEMPDPNPIDSINSYFLNPSIYNLKMFAYQLSDATDFHQKTNDVKYSHLKIAMTFMMIGIVSTVIGGFAMLFISR